MFSVRYLHIRYDANQILFAKRLVSFALRRESAARLKFIITAGLKLSVAASPLIPVVSSAAAALVSSVAALLSIVAALKSVVAAAWLKPVVARLLRRAVRSSVWSVVSFSSEIAGSV